MNELWRFRLALLRNIRANRLTRAAELEALATCPRGFPPEWGYPPFLGTEEERDAMILKAETIRAVYDDPSWVYRALERWKLSGDEDSQLACSTTPSHSAVRVRVID